MRKHLLVAVAATAAIVFAAFGPGLAGAETAPTGTTDTISIQEVNGTLKFVAPKTVTQGDELEIVNETNPKKVGPHTFSLVTKGSVPKTKAARQKCFTPKHICMAIAHWHGVKGEGPPTINPATAGPEGWSTLGSVSKKGDSWFTGTKPGASYSQQVTADPAMTRRSTSSVRSTPGCTARSKILPAGS